MMRLFDYSFYRVYTLFKKKGEEGILGPSFFVSCCLGTLLVPTFIVGHRRFWGDFSEWTALVFYMMVCSWLYVRYKKRKDRILAQFKDSPYNKRIHIFFIYLMIPVCTLTGVLIGEILEKIAAL